MDNQSMTDEQLEAKAYELGVYDVSLTREGLYEAIIAKLED